MTHSAVGRRRPTLALTFALALSGPCAAAGGAEAPAPPPSLPDVRSVVKEREKAVVRVEAVEHYFPGLLRRGLKLLNPFPLSSNINDAFSFAFYVPSVVLPGLRRHVGSGVLFEPDGYLLTNYHVVDDGDSLRVRLTDAKGVKRKFDAEVVASDRQTDVALVKFDPGKAPLVTAPLGDSDQLAVGDWTIVIGHPFRLTGSVTCGVVSGLHRQLRENGLEDFIQIEASVNPGNSGGPVLNARGEVVGIVCLGVFPESGIGFAIPTGLIAPFLDDMKRSGEPRRGYLGVSVRDINADLAKDWKLDAEAGVVVGRVGRASPGREGGLKKGDIIVSVGGRPVTTAQDVHMAVLRTPPGTVLPITIRRGGKTLDLQPKIAPCPSAASFRIL